VKKPGLSLLWICLLLNLIACSALEGDAALPVDQVVEVTPLMVTTSLQVGDPTPGPASNTTPALASHLPTATSTPERQGTPGCLFEKGQLESRSLSSELLPQPLEYSVYLPPCYDQNPERSYPVLYLVHGQGFSHDQWDRLGVDESADELIAAGEISPLLIVMPGDRSWAQPGEDMFGQALVTELVPQVDSAYRTLAQRDDRAVGGLSRGAAWAVHLGLLHWQVFGAVGAHSLPVFYSDASKISTWLDAIPAESMPRIYLDIGEKDRPEILESALWFENLLVEKGISHEWHLFSGYHEESYWQAHVEQYLRWYARGW